jgi:SAM-dependent methyltransferase
MNGRSLKDRLVLVGTAPILLARALLASREAERLRGPGLRWARFGRSLGWRLLRRGVPHGIDLILTPVSIVRYWEFDFVGSCLPARPGVCLDVSSPRLLSLRIAESDRATRVDMINPDARDADLTRRIVRTLAVPRVTIDLRSIEDLAATTDRYDSAWAVSVVEHIAGENGDTSAVKTMYRALAPGGRLVVTVPVDRLYRLEYRDENEYALENDQDGSGKGFFFQRYYDERALRARLLEPIGRSPSILRWFGERTPGRFLAYERRWRRFGHRVTVDDPAEIARHYKEFDTWQDMPGIGVCGFMIERAT